MTMRLSGVAARRTAFATALLLGSITLAGCLPAAPRYYRPSASIGARMAEPCNTIIGPRETLRIRFGDVDVRFSGADNGVSMRLQLTENAWVSLQGNEALVQRGAMETTRPLRGFDYYDREQKQGAVAAPGDTLHGVGSRRLFAPLPLRASMTIDVSGDETPAYTIVVPPLLVNGELRALPPITFTRRRGVGLFLLNC
jgi:hypothetical protein